MRKLKVGEVRSLAQDHSVNWGSEIPTRSDPKTCVLPTPRAEQWELTQLILESLRLRGPAGQDKWEGSLYHVPM